MPLKIITDRNFASDNGNKPLCLSCSRALVKSGTHSQSEVICRATEPERSVSFIATQCTHYISRDLMDDAENSAPVRPMLKIAWVFERVKGKLTLVPPESDHPPHPRTRRRKRSSVARSNPSRSR